LTSASEAFDQSNGFFENPYAAYNIGLVYWMTGDKASAYNAFYRAMAITRLDELRKVHEAALGAVSIYNGDYRLAVIHLNKAEKNEINLFNQGLANFLAEDYYNALIQFEESAILDISNGYPFYGMALIAARNGEEIILYENLSKAVSRSAYLRKRAPLDMEFIRYHDKVGFKDAIR
jgi:tetratricopeptide (TPR) repeat protein